MVVLGGALPVARALDAAMEIISSGKYADH